MSTNNKVFQVLVTKGNKAVLAKGQALETLQPGQIGFFDKDTNLSIDGTAPVKDFYVALGVGKDSLEDVYFSAGQEVQVRNIRNYTFKKYTEGVAQVVEISDFKANCDTEYGVRVEVVNMDVLNSNGFTPSYKTYIVRTNPCEGCEPCPSGSKAELASKLVKAINADKDAFIKAELLGPSGDVVPDIDTFVADPNNKNVAIKVRITTLPRKLRDFGHIHPLNSKLTGTTIQVALIAGFEGGGKVATTVEGKSEEGDGESILAKEYFAGGYNGRPGAYRIGASTQTPYTNFVYMAERGGKYHQFNLVYDHFSTSGWGEYLNNLNTMIAIPSTDNTTKTGVAKVLDAIAAQVGLPAMTPNL